MMLGDGTGRSRDALYRWVDNASFTVSLPDGRLVTTLRVEQIDVNTPEGFDGTESLADSRERQDSRIGHLMPSSAQAAAASPAQSSEAL